MILALDFETSGLDPKRHAPVSLGVALMDGAEVVSSAQWTIAPPTDKNGRISREYDVCALEISGATWTAIRKGTPPAAVCHELAEFVDLHDAKCLTVVAFNAPFDFAFYSELLMMAGSWNQTTRNYETFKPPLVGPWQCARLLTSVRVWLERYNLDTVAAHFGLARTTDQHGALEDAILAGQVYAALEALPVQVAA